MKFIAFSWKTTELIFSKHLMESQKTGHGNKKHITSQNRIIPYRITW